MRKKKACGATDHDAITTLNRIYELTMRNLMTFGLYVRYAKAKIKNNIRKYKTYAALMNSCNFKPFGDVMLMIML